MRATESWSSETWRSKPAGQQVNYADHGGLARATAELRRLPPLVTVWEIERLRRQLADAEAGRRFVLQGGDCAESLADCRSEIITNKLKILLQMSLVLVQGTRQPVTRIGRFAGQYAKPRSQAVEQRVAADGTVTELPSYFGDLVNRPEFSAAAREPDPSLLVSAFQQAAITLNFIRSLSAGGFADLHHPENWDLAFFDHATLTPDLRRAYQQTVSRVSDALHFMTALSEATSEELARVEFFTCHEGLHLEYEAALTRDDYNLGTHLPWIGERTRSLGGAHVELFRGIKNPVGVKLGPTVEPLELVELCRVLNPHNEHGKLVLTPRLGAERVGRLLPPLVDAVHSRNLAALWVADPMHGNTTITDNGQKTRSFADILKELEISFDVHQTLGSHLAGVHFELTGDDVTECIGAGTSEADLSRNYASACDPRLNYRQALEMAFRIAEFAARGV